MIPQPPASMPTTDFEECSKDIPRYLYRVYAPDSNGRNSPTTIASAAASNDDSCEKLSDMASKNTRDILIAHFRWLHFKGDPFVSWTSSLLYALQFAVRKTRNMKYPKSVSQENDLKLCVLDTSAVNTSVFFRASDLLRVYNISSDSELPHEYHTTEYLLYGKLDIEGHSRTVSLSTLREEGLFDLIPELDEEEEKTRLWLRVNELRGSIASTCRPILGKEGGLALWIATLFGGALTMPVMIAFLSLRRRDPNDGGLIRVLCEFADPARDFRVPHANRNFDPVDAPELANFASIMDAGFREMRKIRAGKAVGIDGLEAAVEGLRLESDEESDG